MIRRTLLISAAFAAFALGAACTSDDDSTATPDATTTATAPTATEVPSETPNATIEATPEASPTTVVPSGDPCSDLAAEAVDAAFVFVITVAPGAYLESGDTVEGCSRTFESNVPWYLVDREGNTIAESFAMGGGVDGPAPFEFTVEYEVDEAQVGHLFVGGDDPSGGEGSPPSLNQIPVVLLP